MSRKFVLPLMAAAVVSMLASSANAGINVLISITASTPGTVTPLAGGAPFTGGTWQAFAMVTSTDSTLIGTLTSGLGGIQIDVTGSNGLTVYDFEDGDNTLGTSVKLPFSNGNSGGYSIGFTTQKKTGTDGQVISAYQSNNYTIGTGQDAGLKDILTNVGLVAGTQFGTSWANPVLVAQGFYQGTGGKLTIDGATNFVTLLPPTMPTATVGGANVQTFSPDMVNGVAGLAEGTASVTVGAVPEPASLGMLALGGLALLARRRKSA